MVVQRQGEHWHGDGPEDVWAYFASIWKSVDSVAHWKRAVCGCGNSVFNISLDDEGDGAERICIECGHVHRILEDPNELSSSGEFLLGEELREEKPVSTEALCIYCCRSPV